MNKLKKLSHIFIAATFSLWMPCALQAADSSLVSNGNMEMDSNNDQWPDAWPRLVGNSTWEKEEGNAFLRVKATEPDKMLALYREIPIPEGVKALELSYRTRCTDLKAGKQPWFDARIIMDFKDASGEKIKPSPAAPFVRGSTKGWITKTTLFSVPEGAVNLAFMPALFQVQSGTMDLDDIVLRKVDPAEVAAAEARAREKAPPKDPTPEAPRPENWPKEVRVAGNRLVDPDGKEVWLQGLSVASLEWNPRGDSVLSSIKVGIEEWKANAIRLPVKVGFWFGEGADDPAAKAYRELVDAAVNMAANRGAYLILDNHGYRAVRDEDVAFWKDAAKRYKNHPAVLFDMLNEPHTISWDQWKHGGFIDERKTKADEDVFTDPEELKKAKLGFESPGMQKLLEEIRATGARNVVVAGALDWAYDNSGILKGYALEDATGNGVMYAAHIYPWKSDWQGKVLDIAAVHPIFVGEVGANNKRMNWLPLERQEDPATWVPDMLGTIQKYRLNWTGWCFHPSASPVMLADWKYTPNPEWGQPAKDALAGKQFEVKKLR